MRRTNDLERGDLRALGAVDIGTCKDGRSWVASATMGDRARTVLIGTASTERKALRSLLGEVITWRQRRERAHVASLLHLRLTSCVGCDLLRHGRGEYTAPGMAGRLYVQAKHDIDRALDRAREIHAIEQGGSFADAILVYLERVRRNDKWWEPTEAERASLLEKAS